MGVGKPCSCMQFLKTVWILREPGTTSHVCCIWTCNEIAGLCDKFIITIVPSYIVHCCKPYVQSMEVWKSGGSTVFTSIISDTSVSGWWRIGWHNFHESYSLTVQLCACQHCNHISQWIYLNLITVHVTSHKPTSVRNRPGYIKTASGSWHEGLNCLPISSLMNFWKT